MHWSLWWLIIDDDDGVCKMQIMVDTETEIVLVKQIALLLYFCASHVRQYQ